MAAGDHNMDICPQCMADNRHCNVSRVASGIDERFYIECTQCGTRGPLAYSAREAITAWNRLPRRRDPSPMPDKKDTRHTLNDIETHIDESVMSFVIDMKYKLRRNNHKGLWTSMAVSDLFTRLLGEVTELDKALFKTEVNSNAARLAIIHECADVANYAMMIADMIKKGRYEKE